MLSESSCHQSSTKDVPPSPLFKTLGLFPILLEKEAKFTSWLVSALPPSLADSHTVSK